MSDKNPAFSQFKDKAETEAAQKLEAVKIRVAELAVALHALISPGATIAVNVGTKKVVKKGDAQDVQLIITRPLAMSGIDMEMFLKPSKEAQPATQTEVKDEAPAPTTDN